MATTTVHKEDNMATTVELMHTIFNQAEELVGTYPSADGLRNAIHAVITIDLDSWNIGIGTYSMEYLNSHPTSNRIYRVVGSVSIIKSVEYLARNYEQARGTSMRIGR